MTDELSDTTFRLTMDIFGFPEFRSLIDLLPDGSVVFSAGMIARGPGQWDVVMGGPRGNDLMVQFSQPLTDKYASTFNCPGKECIWVAKVDIRGGAKKRKVVFEDGVVTAPDTDGKKFIREGSFTALLVNEEEAAEVRKRSRAAFERAIAAPKGESTGFKTPARIAGTERLQRKQIKQAEEDKRLVGAKQRAQLKEAEDEKKKGELQTSMRKLRKRRRMNRPS